MAHATTVNPVVLAGLLRCLLCRSIPSLVRRTIERIAMRRVPHPVTARRGGRTGTGSGKERLAQGGRGRRRRGGCGLAHLGLLRCRGGFYAADLINSIMK